MARPAGRGPLQSLYFDYPHFAAPPVPNGTTRHQVAIVGAGPVGMVAALTLAKYGVASVLLDRRDSFNDGSRAICLARPSMHILEQIGAVGPFLAKALGWTRGRSFYRDQQIYQFEMPHGDNDKYLPMYNLQQQFIEQFLYDAIVGNPLIDVRWQSEIDGLVQHGDGAVIHVTSATGGYDLHADYVLAADGARSAMRGLMGLRLRGDNYEGQYVIADIHAALDLPTERRAYFAPAANPDGTVLLHRQPGDIWRVDYQLPLGADLATAIEESVIRAKVGAILAGIGFQGSWDLEWWSIYTANTLCLDDYMHGRVIFIGDAAHIVPIFGVRGLNNGLADAFNIGWKLGYVLAGVAAPALLDSYTPERRGATLDVFANATKSTRFMTPPSRGWWLLREAALSLALTEDFARQFADPRQMQPYRYPGSGEHDGFAIGPSVGALATNVKLADGTYLLDRCGAGFTFLVFGAASRALFDDFAMLDPRFTGLIVGVDIQDPFGAIARAYGAVPGAVYLLRPDLHVAGRWQWADRTAMLQTLRASLGGIAA